MKRETVVLSFMVVASFTACAPEYILGGGGGDGGSMNGASGAFAGDGGNNASQAGTSAIAGHAAGGAAGSSAGRAGAGGRVGTGGTAGAPAIGNAAGSAEAGATSPPLSVVCDGGTHLGGYVNPCALSLGEAGADGAPAETACQAYDLVGAYWNGDTQQTSCTWQVDDIARSTGTGIERGALSSLNALPESGFIETIDGLHAIAVGMDVQNQYRLYTLELATGTTTTTALVDMEAPTLAGELSPGRYVIAGWDAPSTSEIAYIFDARTGVWSIGGYLKSLMSWTSQIVLDRAARRLYALGTPGTSSPTLLYRVWLVDDPQGGGSMVDYRPFAWNGFFGGVTNDGEIVAANNEGSSWYVATIDPDTLSVTRKGTFGDLSGMSGFVYDATLGVAYTVGQDNSGTGAPFLYSVNLASGSWTKVSVSHEYGLARQ